MMMMMMAVMAMMVLAWVMIVLACDCSGSDKVACHHEGRLASFVAARTEVLAPMAKFMMRRRW